MLAINLLLTLVWVALSGSFTLWSLASGFVLGFAALWVAQPIFGPERSGYSRRMIAFLQLIGYFLYELLVSSFRVAGAVLSPRRAVSPRILEVPLDVTSDLEILLVTNLISLTPGTLSLDVSRDRRHLYVHAMFAEDPDQEIRALKDGMETRVRRAFAP